MNTLEPESLPPSTSTDTSTDNEGTIWARAPRRPRGRPPTLSRERIVQTAVALADAEGLQGFSLRRLAARLGVSTMAVYWYIDRKEDMLELMVDAVYSELAPPQPASGDWRTDCIRLATLVRQVMLRHPWFATHTSNRPVLGPNALQLHEQMLAMLDGLALDPGSTVEIAALIGLYVRGFVQQELGEVEAQRRSGLSEAEWNAAIAPYIQEHIIENMQYPHLAHAFLHAQKQTDDQRFAFGLTCILDGIAAHVGQPPTPAPHLPHPQKAR